MLEDVHARDQLSTIKAMHYAKEAEPVSRYAADIQRLAILGKVGSQELVKLDAFREGMPSELQRHCLTRPDGSKFETLAQLVAEMSALLTASLTDMAGTSRTHSAVKGGSGRAATSPSGAGACTSGVQARTSKSPDAKRSKLEGPRSWDAPSDLCTRCWTYSGHRSVDCASKQLPKPAVCPERPAGSGSGGAAVARVGRGGKTNNQRGKGRPN